MSHIELTLNLILKSRGETYANIICHISSAIQKDSFRFLLSITLKTCWLPVIDVFFFKYLKSDMYLIVEFFCNQGQVYQFLSWKSITYLEKLKCKFMNLVSFAVPNNFPSLINHSSSNYFRAMALIIIVLKIKVLWCVLRAP